MVNPFAVTASDPGKRGVFAEHAHAVRRGFLYRVLRFEQPFEGTLLYSSWWWQQRIEICGHRVWHRISWVTIHRRAEFRLPVQVDPVRSAARLEIDFGNTLAIRRFRLWIGDQIVYDEIN